MGLLDLTTEQSDSFLDFGTGLLSAGGPSRMPVSLGQAFAGGVQSMRQGDQQRLQNRMLNAQIGMMPGQLQMQQMQIDAAKITDDRKKAFERMLPSMPEEVQQAYMMAGPEKAFDMWNQSRVMGQFKDVMAPQQTPAPRPYQQSVAESLDAMPDVRIQADTPEQQRGLLDNLAKMDTKYPQDAARLREQLVQQGIIKPQVQTQQPDWNKVAELSANAQLAGIKGAPGMMELAKFNKPDWTAVNSGGQTSFVNKNASQMPTIQMTDSPELAFQKSKFSTEHGFTQEGAANIETTAKAIAEGRLPPPSGMALTNPRNQQILAKVMEINPNYDFTDVTAKRTAASNFSSGQLGNQMRSFATAGQHLDQMGHLVDALGNNDVNLINKVANAYGSQTGSTAPTNFDAAKDVVAKEVMKAIISGGGGQAEREELARSLSTAKSPEQLKGVIKTYRDLMGAQYDNLLEQRRSAGLSDSTMPNYRGASSPTSPSQAPGKTVVGTGLYGGKKVVKYSDGSVDYAN